MRGEFSYQHRDVEGRVVRSGKVQNLVTIQGLSNLLRAWVDNNTSLLASARFAGLIDDVGFVDLLHTDTAAAHPSWTEITDYASPTRPAPINVVEDLAAGTVALTYSFTMSVGGHRIRGFLVSSSNVKGGSAGFLWAEAALDDDDVLTPLSGEYIEYTYTFMLEQPEPP